MTTNNKCTFLSLSLARLEIRLFRGDRADAGMDVRNSAGLTKPKVTNFKTSYSLLILAVTSIFHRLIQGSLFGYGK